MELIEFPEQTAVFAKDQPQYRPLPAHQVGNAEGEIICCWRLTWRERFAVLLRGVLWHHVLTFRQPLQPQLLAVDKPAMGASAQRIEIARSMRVMRPLRNRWLHYWAGKEFDRPGFYRWNGKRNVRALPVPRWLARVLPS